MITQQEVDAQIKALKSRYIFYTRKEIRHLPKIMTAGERILGLTSGYIDTRTWLLVCTTYRVIFLHRGILWGLHQVQMNLDRVQAIDSSYGLVFGSIRMWDGASSMNVNMVLKQTVGPFVRTVQEAMDRYKRQMVHDIAGSVRNTQAAASPTSVPAHPAAAPQWVVELEKLSKLKADGHLSDAEFAAAKAKLLSHP